MCKERMGGRKKVYTNLDAPAAKESVRRWVEGLTEGHSRRHGIYSVNRYVIWRRSRGLETDPDSWVEECAEGNVRTLTGHLKVLQDYVKSPEFEGDSNARPRGGDRLKG